MFGDYETEEQQVDALKAWWRANGTAIIAGAVIGVAGIFGYRYWDGAMESARQAQADQMVALTEAVAAAELDTIDAAAAPLLADGGAYGYGAAMLLAKFQLEQGDLDAALAQVDTALTMVDEAPLVATAKLRRARILSALARFDDAIAALPAELEGMNGVIAEVRGDILLANGKLDDARAAYSAALAANEPLLSSQELVQYKLDDAQAAYTGSNG